MTSGDDQAGGEMQLARPNSITYIQIPASDPERSAAFYETVFGWTVRRNPGHTSFDDVSGYVSGSFEPGREISREPGVLPYIYVDGIDATLEQVEAHGGAVVMPVYPEGDLWVATFRDPAGNIIGVWQAGPR
jgi:predicted enzyme related to lactoylglutathione lyase